MNTTEVDNRIFSVEIIDLPTMRCVVFYLWEPLGEARSAKVAERINRHSLPKYARAYNWILFMDFI